MRLLLGAEAQFEVAGVDLDAAEPHGLEALAELVGGGRLRHAHELPLAQAGRAHELMDERPIGKVVLTV